MPSSRASTPTHRWYWRSAAPRRPLEGHGVDLDGARPQRQRVAVLLQSRRIAERPAYGEQCLPQTRPRGLLAHSAPQQRGELVARVRAADGKREIREQRLRLARGQGDRRSRLEPGVKPTEEREMKPRHAPRGGRRYHFSREL